MSMTSRDDDARSLRSSSRVDDEIDPFPISAKGDLAGKPPWASVGRWVVGSAVAALIASSSTEGYFSPSRRDRTNFVPESASSLTVTSMFLVDSLVSSASNIRRCRSARRRVHAANLLQARKRGHLQSSSFSSTWGGYKAAACHTISGAQPRAITAWSNRKQRVVLLVLVAVSASGRGDDDVGVVSEYT